MRFFHNWSNICNNINFRLIRRDVARRVRRAYFGRLYGNGLDACRAVTFLSRLV